MELNHASNGKMYGFETKEIGTGWGGDTGFRHRVVCDDGRISGWADYTRVSFLDDVACVSPYFHDTTNMRLVTLKEAMSFIAVGEVIETAEGEVQVYPADNETVALQELSEIPTHIWFPGKKLKNARAPFELCWKVAPHADDDSETMTFSDYDGNQYATVSGLGIPNEHGSIVLELGDHVLVIDHVNHFWGVGETLEKAIKAMPNNMEALPFTCKVFVGPQGMRVDDNGTICVPSGSSYSLLFTKDGKKISPNTSK